MFLVGYNTPFRIVLLLLIRSFCTYKFPGELVPHFIVFITNNVLNEDQCKKTCSEPTLEELATQIRTFTDDDSLRSAVEECIMNDLREIMEPHGFDEFMCSLGSLLDKGKETVIEAGDVTLDRISVLGLFVRKCRISYEQLAPTHLFDIYSAFQEYINHRRGDTQLTGEKDERATGWVSDYNVNEFLKYQAEQIEITGTTNITTSEMHRYLKHVEKQLPSITNIRQVRYLNYTRSKEYIQSLFYLHLWSDSSLDKGVGMQYAQLNAGILEYKFGHLYNALLALNDALSAARSNKDQFCLQEVQYWIEVCRKEQPFNDSSSYTDTYLKNLKTLSKIRNMLRNGYPCKNIFENLYRSLIDIITNDIKYMDRVQYLIASLSWKRYGNDVMASSYLNLAQHFGGESIEEIENTVITSVNKAQELGESERALEEIQAFVDNYRDEKDFLMGWRQAKARLLKQPHGKRMYEAMEYDADTLQFSAPLNSEEYFSAIHDHACELIRKREMDKALNVLNSVHDYMQKTHQTSQLSPNLILQATVHLKINSVKTAVPILEQAMKLARKYHDSHHYYSAVIRLSEAYVRLNDASYLEKALYMLENIFPKVLLAGSKLLESDLNLTYAFALDASKKTRSADSKETLLECILQAEKGYKQLCLEDKVLKTLHFKASMQAMLGLVTERAKTMDEIRELSSHY